MSQMELPVLPVQPEDFLSYVEQNPSVSIPKLLEPFLEYEGALRRVFAQAIDHPVVQNPTLNLVDVFKNNNHQKARIRGRDLLNESQEEKEKYIAPLCDEERLPDGELAIVESFQEFQNNFNIFSESAFINFDWENVVAAGSSVVNPLLKVPKEYAGSRRGIREYFHETVAPSSDVDLFIYGIDDEKAAIERMLAIERIIRDNLLCETTAVRTKNCITIASQYPHRHVQIVLRLYKSITQILTGFDVNCSCVAYNGTSVFASPRSLAAYMTQCNHMDLTRRSPSYEQRLSKYSHRGFEIYCPCLNRSRVDPTIYERSFHNTVGLARLLVLERLPKPEDREKYIEQRKSELGRPGAGNCRISSDRNYRGDLKAGEGDDIPEWLPEDVSAYGTFSVPYGRPFNAKKIERLFFTKDLLLNAEWNAKNMPPEREVHLHRHPAFFGTVGDVIVDCCGFCPVPETPEEIEIYQEESKIYIHGPVTFLQDDPGRQEIGSFNPLNPEDYTEMAYITESEILFQAIVNDDVNGVREWCRCSEGDVNRRDHCGRAPLHVAASCANSVEIVQLLIDKGARLIARLQDGRTALHIAAGRGKNDFVQAILRRSELNEEEKMAREDRKRLAKKAEKSAELPEENEKEVEIDGSDDESDLNEFAESGSYNGDATSATQSFVKIKPQKNETEDIYADIDVEDDVLDVNVTSWDFSMTALHHAILGNQGEQEAVIETLVSSHGADVLLPIKLLNDHDRSPRNAILSLLLPLRLPYRKNVSAIVRTLLRLGATCAQANSITKTSALHYCATSRAVDALKVMFELDEPAARSVMNRLSCGSSHHGHTLRSPINSAIRSRNEEVVKFLLDKGAAVSITLKDFVEFNANEVKGLSYGYDSSGPDSIKDNFKRRVEQPIEACVIEMPSMAKVLIEAGADPSTVLSKAYSYGFNYSDGRKTILDVVRTKIRVLTKTLNQKRVFDQWLELNYGRIDIYHYTPPFSSPPPEHDLSVLDRFPKDSYQRFMAEDQLLSVNRIRRKNLAAYAKYMQDEETKQQDRLNEQKLQKIMKLLLCLQELEKVLLDHGAKTYEELFPHMGPQFKDTVEEEVKDDEFKAQFIFQGVVTEGLTNAYIELFEAVWSGDLDQVKKLTLLPGNGASENPPLEIAIVNPHGLSTFSCAIYRGHLSVAKAILQIAQAQFDARQGQGKKKDTYVLRGDDTDSEGCDVSSQRDDVFDIHRHIRLQSGNDVFTIDNIALKGDLIGSKVSPLLLMLRSFPPLNGMVMPPDESPIKAMYGFNIMGYAILKDDNDLVKTLLSLARSTEEDGDWQLLLPDLAFPATAGNLKLALGLGRVAILETLIQETGCGIDYEALEETETEDGLVKPKYYQGLTVNGEKRRDWAKNADPNSSPTFHNEPLLHFAAYYGNIDAVHWLFSDRPLYCFQEFTRKHPRNKRAEMLQRLPNLDEAVRRGVGVDSPLLPHLCIRGWNGHSMPAFKALLKKNPDYLEIRTPTGLTPLHTAALCKRIDAIRVLISEGANVYARDDHGRNAIHFALNSLQKLEEFFACFTEGCLRGLFTRRASGMTPLYSFMNQHPRRVDMLKIVLKACNGIGLDIINGDGNLPIHKAAKDGGLEACELLLDARPDLIMKENSNGRTPLDIATDMYLHDVVRNPLPPIIPEEEETRAAAAVYEMLLKKVQSTPAKRKRATLFEANELAKRLANANKNVEPYQHRHSQHDADDKMLPSLGWVWDG